MNKSISWVMIGVGVLVLLFSFGQVRTLLKIPLSLNKTVELIVMTAGAVIAIVGVFLISKSSTPEQPSEVPIYEGHGKERRVVAIQRMGKK